eukprot:SM000130S27118  [mRNA]  locus=s130:282815:287260:- [translate_table: standard]
MVSIRRKNPRWIRPTEVAAGPGSPRTIYLDKGGSSDKRSILPSKVSSCSKQHKHRSWRVLLRWNGKQVYLRSLPSREEATRMYRRALYVTGKLRSEIKLTVDERTELSGLSWQGFISTESMRLQKQGHAKLKVTVVPDGQELSHHSATDEHAISTKGDEGRQGGSGGTHDEGRVPDQGRPQNTSTRTQASPQDLHIKQQSEKKRAQNVQVRRDVSKLRGVSDKYGKWQASIKVGSKKIHLGMAATSLDAAKLYDRAAFVLQRTTNFPLSNADKEELSQRTWESHLASLHVVNFARVGHFTKRRESEESYGLAVLDRGTHSLLWPPGPVPSSDASCRRGRRKSGVSCADTSWRNRSATSADATRPPLSSRNVRIFLASACGSAGLAA